MRFAWLPGEKAAFAVPRKADDWRPEWIVDGDLSQSWRDNDEIPKAPMATWTRDQWLALYERGGAAGTAIGLIILLYGPADLSIGILSTFIRRYPTYAFKHLPEAVARHEISVYPHVLAQLRSHPRMAIGALGPFDSAELVPSVLGLAQLVTTKAAAQAWLCRHPRAAAVGLLALSLANASGSKMAGKTKRQAEAALQLLRDRGHGAVIDKATAAMSR